MKVGDVVRLCSNNYPQYKDKIAMLMWTHTPQAWVVLVNQKLHPYVVHEDDMRGLNESR